MANRLSRPALALTLFVPKAATYRAYAGSLFVMGQQSQAGEALRPLSAQRLGTAK